MANKGNMLRIRLFAGWTAAVCLALNLLPAPSAGAIGESRYFHAWGTIRAVVYGPEDVLAPEGLPGGLGQPNKVNITILGGTPNVEKMRVEGYGLSTYTDQAEWRTGITTDDTAQDPDVSMGALIQLIGRVEKTADGGRKFNVQIARTHEFALSARLTGAVDMHAVTDDGSVQEQSGTIAGGPLAGWTMTATVACDDAASVTWTAADSTGNSVSGLYTSTGGGPGLGGDEQLATSVTGGSGTYAGATGGARFNPACQAGPVDVPVTTPFEIDLA